MTMPEHLFLLRLSGEIYLKGAKTRAHFFRRLLANLKAALVQHRIPFRLEPTWSRLYLHTPDPEAAAVAARVFGLRSVSEVHRREWTDLEALVRAGRELFAADVQGRSFAVRARRRRTKAAAVAATTDTILAAEPVRSPDVERALGRALLDAGAARVDLGHPEVEVHVDFEPGVAHLFRDRVEGAGGLPIGVEGRAVVLLSGGFDSAVAAWQLLKRGVQLDYVFCNLGGAPHRLGALRVARLLAERWSYGSAPRLFELDFLPLAAQLQERVPGAHRQLLLKRAMLRAGAAIARRRRALAVGTGDALGQVSSQTLQNLAVASRAVPETLLLRPLVGQNKEEILAAARQIGVFETAAAVEEYCALGAERPATRADLGRVVADEALLDPRLLPAALASCRAYELRDLDLESLPGPPAVPEIDVVPAGTIVLDLRPAEAFRAWHWAEAVRLDLPHALAALPHLDRGRAYVVVCEVGVKSAALAETMQRQGFRVALFRGGSAAMRSAAAASS
jgi:thiamine biosynthesis protein ThiI